MTEHASYHLKIPVPLKRRLEEIASVQGSTLKYEILRSCEVRLKLRDYHMNGWTLYAEKDGERETLVIV